MLIQYGQQTTGNTGCCLASFTFFPSFFYYYYYSTPLCYWDTVDVCTCGVADVRFRHTPFFLSLLLCSQNSLSEKYTDIHSMHNNIFSCVVCSVRIVVGVDDDDDGDRSGGGSWW